MCISKINSIFLGNCFVTFVRSSGRKTHCYSSGITMCHFNMRPNQKGIKFPLKNTNFVKSSRKLSTPAIVKSWILLLLSTTKNLCQMMPFTP